MNKFVKNFCIIFIANSINFTHTKEDVTQKRCKDYTKNKIYIIVPGTWSLGETWHTPIGIEFKSLEILYADSNVKFISHVWNGINSHSARELSGMMLARKIDSYPKSFKKYLICHSHGVNIAIIASQILEQLNKNDNHKSIQAIYALGGPVNEKLYCPNMNQIKYIYNFYSFGDLIQPVFGFYARRFLSHERIANIRLTLDGKNPGHIPLHCNDIVKWLPQIKLDFKNNNTSDLAIQFYSYQKPVFEHEQDLEKLLSEDQKMITIYRKILKSKLIKDQSRCC